MNPSERLDLKRLIHNNSDYKDNTEGIRKLKHSDLIQAEILKLEFLKKKDAKLRIDQPKVFEDKCKRECSFLFNQYMEIFNPLMKDELDIGLMNQALTTLKMIEDGEIDQQEGSVMMGKILHRVFVESAVKGGKNINDRESAMMMEERNPGKHISWLDFKNKNKSNISI
jgi:hypothetical protein